LLSPDRTYDETYISNYGLLNVRDKLMRLYGVADVSLYGVREYSMRVWLDPGRIAPRGLTAEPGREAPRPQNRPGASRPAAAAPWASRRSTSRARSRCRCR